MVRVFPWQMLRCVDSVLCLIVTLGKALLEKILHNTGADFLPYILAYCLLLFTCTYCTVYIVQIQYGEMPIFFLSGVQKPVRATPLKIPIFKKIQG